MAWRRATGILRASAMRRSRPRRFVKALQAARRVDWRMAPSWRFSSYASTVLRCARRRCPRGFRLDFDERAGFLIDQTPYRADEIAFSVSRGTREVWEIKNSPISMPHPMHLHGFGFRVLRRQGTYGEARRLATEPGGRLATDLGVKDTVVLWPNETLWLAMDFTLPPEAAFRGAQRFMFHCHNLEHEDGMMMRNFTVI